MTLERAKRSLVESSIDLIVENQDPTGAYIAAPGYGAYAYSWLRDGAFIATAMDTYGRTESSQAFHRWAASSIEQHAHKVERLETEADIALKGTGDPLHPLDDRYVLHTRFTVDGSEGQDAWGNFQLDSYGFWLTSVTQHISQTGTDPGPYVGAIETAERYLALAWDHPCFDAWEEYPTRRHTATWAAVAKGLDNTGRLLGNENSTLVSKTIRDRLVDIAGPRGRLPKFVPEEGSRPDPIPAAVATEPGHAVAGHERPGRLLDPDAIDGGAVLVLGPFGPFQPDHRIVSATVQAIEDTLIVGGGVHRYLDDEYYGGGLWTVLAGALAQVQAERDPARAKEILNWIEHEADSAGHLGEQSATHLRNPQSLEPWIERWGHPARPLLWSHAMYLLGSASLSPGLVHP